MLNDCLTNISATSISLIHGFSRINYLPIDLSSSNNELSIAILENPKLHQEWIATRLRENGCSIAYGGYLEHRKLYDSSSHFQAGSDDDKRNIHLGIDLWCDAGSTVLAPMDGIIHSFKNNTHFGDYGPTLILEHHIKEYIFFTLYGHLNKDSLTDKYSGQIIKEGEAFAQLGNSKENGTYAPHLHFQIIKDMQGRQGDYPGVCSKSQLDFYKQNCPDPNLLLKIY